MTNIEDAAVKIVARFEDVKVKLSKKAVLEDLKTLVEKYEMLLPDAVKAATAKYARENNVQMDSGGEKLLEIGKVSPETWVTVEGQVVSVGKPNTARIHQTAIITDDTGTIKVTSWNRNPGEPRLLDLKVGNWYTIKGVNASVYNGVLSLNTAKNSTIVEIKTKGDIKQPVTQIKDVTTGIISLKAKVTKLFNVKSDKVARAGVIGDETGTIRFTAWKSEVPNAKINEGESYLFEFATVQRDTNNLSVVLSPNIKKIKDEIIVKTNDIDMFGNIVSVGEGSGLIRRCKAEGCNRPLGKMNFCQVHGGQKDFKYDLRIKAVLDDGWRAKNIHLPLEPTEEIIGMKLDDVIKKVEGSATMGADDFLAFIRDKIIGRYYIVSGSDFNDRIYVSETIKANLDDMKSATLLEFKHEQQPLVSEGV